jgi:peptide/nickel transport system substrate-binding protein
LLLTVKAEFRWPALAALVGVVLIATLLLWPERPADMPTAAPQPELQEGQGSCTAETVVPGGIFVEGVVGIPQRLNPLLSDNNPVEADLVDLLFEGLTRYDDRGFLQPALAESWAVSDDGLTITFTLREEAAWHDGQPVRAADVQFTYGLLQQEAFPAPAGLRLLWQAVTITVVDERTVQFRLPQPYAPFLEATTRGLLPAHLLADIPPAELADHPYNWAPVGAGPFMVADGDNWRRTGRLTLTPNPVYWPAEVSPDGLAFQFFADYPGLLAALDAGDIQAVNKIPATAVVEAALLSNLRLISSPAPRYTQLLFNLTGGATRTQALRQALTFGLDRTLLRAAALEGQGLPLEGPYLATSWGYNAADLTVHTPDLAVARSLLDGAGWPLPEGSQVRQREDAELRLRLIFVAEPAARALAQEMARQWGEIGVGISSMPLASPAFLEALAAREFDLAIVEVDPPGDPDLYDFWSQEAMIRGQNYAGWNNRRASEALEAARQLYELAERRPYYDAFLRFYNTDLPALTLYQHVYTYGLSTAVLDADIGPVLSPRDRYQTLATWRWQRRLVNVPCPDEG